MWIVDIYRAPMWKYGNVNGFKRKQRMARPAFRERSLRLRYLDCTSALTLAVPFNIAIQWNSIEQHSLEITQKGQEFFVQYPDGTCDSDKFI